MGASSAQKFRKSLRKILEKFRKTTHLDKYYQLKIILSQAKVLTLKTPSLGTPLLLQSEYFWLKKG